MHKAQKDWLFRFEQATMSSDWKVLDKHGIGYLVKHESGLVIDFRVQPIEGEYWVSFIYGMHDGNGKPLKLSWEAAKGIKAKFFRKGESLQIRPPLRVKETPKEHVQQYWHKVRLIK